MWCSSSYTGICIWCVYSSSHIIGTCMWCICYCISPRYTSHSEVLLAYIYEYASTTWTATPGRSTSGRLLAIFYFLFFYFFPCRRVLPGPQHRDALLLAACKPGHTRGLCQLRRLHACARWHR